MNENNNKPSGSIEPFNSQPDKNTENQETAEPAKDINIEPVNQEELSMLLSEPTGYADIVKQIRKDTISQDKADRPQKTTDIPEYDLGKQKLAVHRKNTASKRRAPGQKAPIQIKEIPTPAPVKLAPAKPTPMVDTQKPPITDIQSEAIIRDIVAKDIAKLCRCSQA